MSAQAMKATKPSDNVLSKMVPVQRTEVSTFDDSFSFLKEKFAAEMKRVDQEMNKFSADLVYLYNNQNTGTPDTTSSSESPTWETIVTSPLVQGEGEDKSLKLQFDVSQFDPSEIKVQIVNDILMVSATHEEKSENSSVFRELKREFLLPKGINPESVISSLSRDGVLTVEAPLPPLAVEGKPQSAPTSPKSPQSLENQTPHGKKGSKSKK